MQMVWLCWYGRFTRKSFLKGGDRMTNEILNCIKNEINKANKGEITIEEYKQMIDDLWFYCVSSE